jgi:hypothetical protein
MISPILAGMLLLANLPAEETLQWRIVMFRHCASFIACGLALLITPSNAAAPMAAGAAPAGEVSSADVNIVAVEGSNVGKHFVCKVQINNQNDDDAYDAKVIVLLPLQVNVTNMSVTGGTGTCRKATPGGSYNEFAICDLGQLPQGAQVRRDIEIRTTHSTAVGYPQTCSAFIEKKNNYAWSTPVP